MAWHIYPGHTVFQTKICYIQIINFQIHKALIIFNLIINLKRYISRKGQLQQNFRELFSLVGKKFPVTTGKKLF